MKAFGFELKQAARRVFTWKQTGAVLIPAIGLALATVVMLVIIAAASLLPALRVLRIEPGRALNME